MENNLAQEEITAYYKRMLSLLYYNTCSCKTKKAVEMLNPKFHSKKCKYKIEVEKADLKFEDKETDANIGTE